MFSLERKIGYSSLGANGKMRIGAVVDYLQDSSNFHLQSMHFLQEYFRENDVGMYVVSRQLDIERLPRYGEDLVLNTFTHECKNMYGFRNTLIYTQSKELCVKANTTGAFINLKTAKPVKIPQNILEQIPIEPKFNMEYLPRKVKIPDIDAEKFDELKVRRYHIDSNRHINNAKFLDIAEDFLPEDYYYDCGNGGRSIKRVMIEYKSPASQSDVIKPERYIYDNKVIIKLGGADENVTFAVIEFTY
ncbi:MAG: thioesterase [Oscillospiraceae bacterium]|nr:thioesterase [Oscillospiraceae bacterium]